MLSRDVLSPDVINGASDSVEYMVRIVSTERVRDLEYLPHCRHRNLKALVPMGRARVESHCEDIAVMLTNMHDVKGGPPCLDCRYGSGSDGCPFFQCDCIVLLSQRVRVESRVRSDLCRFLRLRTILYVHHKWARSGS